MGQNGKIRKFSKSIGGRELFKGASQLVVEKVFKENVGHSGSIVELGSGIGELSGLVPEEYRDRLIEIEKTEKFSGIHKKNSPETKAVVGDIYELPIKDGGTETVVSFSVFDTLANLEKAVAEVRRILKDGGKFIHMLDLQPNVYVLMRECPPDTIPFPNMTKGELTGYQLVARNDYEKMRREVDPRKLPMFDLYVEDPVYAYGLLHQNKQDILAAIASTVKQWDIDKKTTPTFQAGFGEKLVKALEGCGLKVLSVGNVSADAVVERNEAHDRFPGKNYFDNEVGSMHMKYLPELNGKLQPGHVKEKSTLHVIVAQK